MKEFSLFENYKKFVNKKRKIFKAEADVFYPEPAYDFINAESIQNSVEAAWLEGVNPSLFLFKMMLMTGGLTFGQIAEKYGIISAESPEQ